VYGEKLLLWTRKELAKHTTITVGRDGVITVEVEDKDPKRAADLANGYIEELREMTGRLAISEAAQRRAFFESQLKKAKSDLMSAELELKKFTEASGLVNPSGQIGLSVSAAAALRANIAAKEIQLVAMRTFATETNPDIKRALQELNGLRGELAKMEQNTNSGKGDVMVPFHKAPEVGLEYLRKYRDVKYYETLFEVLAKQYEIARIDEAKDAPVIQAFDVAVPPETRSRPKRVLIVLVISLLAAITALLFVFARETYHRAAANQNHFEKLRRIRALLWRA
jgi:uncharacterized protein involved in exopolysaccharide biosynthesis